jgi:hypothetical protein
MVALALIAIGLGLAALRRIDQLRVELDQTQRQLNELASAAAVVPAPPIPRGRSSGLEDLRQQLRQAHRESDEAGSE